MQRMARPLLSLPEEEGLGRSTSRRIVRALARDGDVVHVAFAQARAGDAHELGLAVQLRHVTRTDITHGGAQAAGELMQHGRGSTFVGHLALDTLGYQLERILDVLLEVAVGGATRHGADRAHPAISLVRTALIEK